MHAPSHNGHLELLSASKARRFDPNSPPLSLEHAIDRWTMVCDGIRVPHKTCFPRGFQCRPPGYWSRVLSTLCGFGHVTSVGHLFLCFLYPDGCC